jgi:hypothetical protein
MSEEQKKHGSPQYAQASTAQDPQYLRAARTGGIIGGLIGALITMVVCFICHYIMN